MTARAFIYTPRRQAQLVVGREGLDQPEWCDVLDQGDGAGIQEALNAAAVLIAGSPSQRADVFLRPGEYTLTAELQIPERVSLSCEINAATLIAPSVGPSRVVTVGLFGALAGVEIKIPESTDTRTGDSWIELATGARLIDCRLTPEAAPNVFDSVTRGVRALELGFGEVRGCLVVGPARQFFGLPDSFVCFDVGSEDYSVIYTSALVRGCFALGADLGFLLGGNVDADGLTVSSCLSGIVLSNKRGGFSFRGPRLRGFQIHAAPITLGFGLMFEGDTNVLGATALQGRIENRDAGNTPPGTFFGAVWNGPSDRCTISLCDFVGDPALDVGIFNDVADNPRALDCAFVDFAVPSQGAPVDVTGTLFLP